MAMSGLVPCGSGSVHAQKTETRVIGGGEIYTSLRNHSLFKECSDEFVQSLVDRCKVGTFRKGTVIVHQGEEGQNMYLILLGSVRVGDESDELVYGNLAAGQFFGEMALLLNMKRTATVRANEFTACLVLTKEELQHVMDQYPDIRAKLNREAEERMKFTEMAGRKKGTTVRRQVTDTDLLGTYRARPLSAYVSKIGVFSDLGDEFMHELCMRMEMRSYAAREVIIREGEDSDSMYFILRGMVNVLVANEVFAELVEGAFFGEIGTLLGMKRTATIQAATYVDTLVLTSDAIKSFLSRYPEVEAKLNEVAQKRYNVVKAVAKRTAPPTTDMQPVPSEARPYSPTKPAPEPTGYLHRLLNTVELFRNVNHISPVLNDLAPLLEYSRFSPKQTIVRAGEMSTHVYFLVLGSVTVETEGVLVAILRSGDMFGEVGVVVGVPRTATVTAIDDVACLSLASEHAKAVLTKYSEIYGRMEEVAQARFQASLARQRILADTQPAMVTESAREQVEEPEKMVVETKPSMFALHINSLDSDILFKIFNQLDVTTKAEAACVCRLWNTVISTSSMWQLADFTRTNDVRDAAVMKQVKIHGSKISHIRLIECQFITNRALETIAQYCSNLVSLEMSSCWKVSNEGLIALSKRCHNLQVLMLTNCLGIGDDGVTALMMACPRLQILGLGFCKKVTDTTMSCIGSNLHYLKVLDLNRCEAVSSQGFLLVATGVLSELRAIRLAHCHMLESEALIAICQGCPMLEFVDVSFCQKLTPEAALVLAERAHNLHTLMLSFCTLCVNNKTISVLCRECKNMRHVSIRGCMEPTTELIEHIAAMYPQLTVECGGCPNIDTHKAKELLGNRAIL